MANRSVVGKAFTLIELLAVIAIICLLAAILMPSLQRARDLARRVPCQANLKAMGVGLQAYAAANRGWFPPSVAHLDPGPSETLGTVTYDFSSWSKGDWRWNWADFLVPYVDSDARPSDSKNHRSWSSVNMQPGDGNYNRILPGGDWDWNYGVIPSKKMRCPSQNITVPTGKDPRSVNPNHYQWYGAYYRSEFWGEPVEWWNAPAGAALPQSTGPYWSGPRPSGLNMERMIQITEYFTNDDYFGGSVPNFVDWGGDADGPWWHPWSGNGLATGVNLINAMAHAGAMNVAYMDGHVTTLTKEFVQGYLDNMRSTVDTKYQGWSGDQGYPFYPQPLGPGK